MVATSPDIDFARIRPYGSPASRPNGFEELSSLLIRQLPQWPANTRFQRYGNPDGGREGAGHLANGDVWAWQSKYLFTFDGAAVAQIQKSFTRALTLEPNLTRYLVTLPIDLPAGDTTVRRSARTLWEQSVTSWQALAQTQGRTVEFEFVGLHELTTILTRGENAGRLRYWFDTELLTPADQKRRIDDVVAKLGRRYSPRLHVDVSPSEALDGLGRSPEYTERWRQCLADLRNVSAGALYAPPGQDELYADALGACEDAISEADSALMKTITSLSTTAALTDPSRALNRAGAALKKVEDLIRSHSPADGAVYTGGSGRLLQAVRDAVSAVSQADSLSRLEATRAADVGELLVSGRAGTGKSHLLCDVSVRRIALGRPTIMVLGQEFDSRAPLTQIAELAETPGTTDDLLALLDAAGEAIKTRALLIIDALNESDKAENWRDALNALRTKAARYPNVGLVVSCRTEYLDQIVGDSDMPEIIHDGFAETITTAVRRFADEYDLEAPSFPLLNSEFGNPLFLRLTCEALRTLGTSRFLLGSAGLSTVCDAFIQSANVRLASPQRCDFDAASNLVEAMVDELASAGQPRFARSMVSEIGARLLPGRTWSKSLMRGLLDEGVLIQAGDDRIAFGYQRLGDVAQARRLTQRSVAEIREWLEPRPMTELRPPRDAGLLGALAVMLPEIHGVELTELMEVDGRVPGEVAEAVLESITLRTPGSVSQTTIDWVMRLYQVGFTKRVWEQLVRVASTPSHPLNARWLHSHLAAMPVARRDREWSEWLIGALSPEAASPVAALTEWAWPSDETEPPAPDREVATLTCLTLGWFLTTPDRRVRDHASKALVSIGGRNPDAFLEALPLLLGANDPYLVERTVGAACAITLRGAPQATVHAITGVLERAFAADRPKHLLTRDYIRRVYDVASASGWVPAEAVVVAAEPWPVDATPRADIEMLIKSSEGYRSIWRSVTSGDFGRYVVESAIRPFQASDRQQLIDLVQRAIFDRVRDLGWTPERFGSIDQPSKLGRRSARAERFGVKYQWIGLFETLGALTDNVQLIPAWSSTEPQPYSYAEQLIWRDIDVTLLARQPGIDVPPPWYSPVAAAFPRELTTEFPADLDQIPDPIDLLTVVDPSGDRWLNILSSPGWRQKHSAEVEVQRPPTRTAWMNIQAYLIPADSVTQIRAWFAARSWDDVPLMETHELSNLLLGSHPSDPLWQIAAGPVNKSEVTGALPPTTLIECGARYQGTGTARDASSEEETRAYVPTVALWKILGLDRGVDFRWMSGQELAVWDPSVVVAGPETLLMRRSLAHRVHDAGYALLWLARANHDLVVGDSVRIEDEPRWVTGSASYVLVGEKIERIASLATLFKRGGERESDVEWRTRASE